ncbi:MAG: putative sugar nucleotidyl transferase [Abditibacteriales bacterium]|nr:putative sugar nucleotidyl transferase [Abditibacteriales bacterium]MDW8365166.1 putative sugar nucleotidyl transferase [Abditibacteriales bacterium]
MKLCIFEDAWDTLFPLTYTRATFELRCGYVSLLERILRNYPSTPWCVFARDYLAGVLKNRVSAPVNDPAQLKADTVLFINGRWLMQAGELPLEGPEVVGVQGQDVLYVRAMAETLDKCAADSFDTLLNNLKRTLPHVEMKATLIGYPWHLIQQNPEAMKADFAAQNQTGIHGICSKHAAVWPEDEGTDKIYVAPRAQIHPFVALDVTHGPIYIDEGAIVYPHTRIEGPAYIGKDTHIVGGKIREGCSIGPMCRVGGEVEESIIHGYSNKYHDGFLGHAYVGEWVNLGALTTNSDLKNDYGTVEVYVQGKPVDSGDTKVGAFIGDHTKTGIGCLFTTGTVVGVMSLLISDGQPFPKTIPSFCWFFRGRVSRGRGLKPLIETARIAMGRRKVMLTEADVALFETLYQITKPERDEAIKRGRERRD